MESTGLNQAAPGAIGPRYVIGIDLGTTNSAIAYADLSVDLSAELAADGAGENRQRRRTIRTFTVPQLVAEGEVAARPVLPSFLYLPGSHDLPAGAAALPWAPDRDYLVGEFAREQGARVPGRLVASAKSWLSHSAVDRTAAILPWGAPAEVARVSPVEASKRTLQHIREAWDATMAGHGSPGSENPDGGQAAGGHRFADQLIILTVPASFDEVARELTVAAAQEAGYRHFVLLEEPLAAFYAWLSRHEVDWEGRMADGQLVLVVDVGGGTTDFTIVGIRAGATGLIFNRLAVGDHLMLGGDNMDMTLGRLLESRLLGRPGKLDAQRWHQLVHRCRQAKEALLGGDAESAKVAIMGSGSQLIASTLTGELARSEVLQAIVDGFFPQVDVSALPETGHRRGLTELGLPYVHDPAVTRHLAAFWQRFAGYLVAETGRTHPVPDYVLYNGGALAPAAIRQRLTSVIAGWFRSSAGPAWAPAELENPHPEAAVAVGAAYYGLVRQGKGVRIGSGSPRAYYVAVETAGDGQAQGVQTAVCVVPRGAEEGFAAELATPEFQALANQPVAFRMLTSSTRLGDKLGAVVQLAPDPATGAPAASELPPIRTVLRFGKRDVAQRLPVRLGVRLTEVGTLQLWCQAQQTDHRWQLQFDIRDSGRGRDSGRIEAVAQVVEATLDQGRIQEAQVAIARTFGGGSGDSHAPEQLRRSLESILDLPKERWPTALIRSLADALLDHAHGRGQSEEHEARWLNLAGYCLRPGYGDPVDEWRMRRVWKLYFDTLHHPRSAQCRTEWWIFWRRVAGGLKAGQQMEVYNQVRPYLQPSSKRKKSSQMLPKHVGAGEMLEVWLTLAGCEWLPVDVKVELGRQLLQQFRTATPRNRELWALGRIGSRTATYGPVDRLIPPQEAAAWVDSLLKLGLAPSDTLAHALVLLARVTGDRARDVEDGVRQRVAGWLQALPKGDHFVQLLTDPASAAAQEEQEWIFGESLPVGLVLGTTATG